MTDPAIADAVARALAKPRTTAPQEGLGPLVLPAWLVDTMQGKGTDVDALARAEGFDGYTVLTAPPGTRPPLEVGQPNRQQRRASKRARRG